MNLPNQITTSRLALAIVLFVLLSQIQVADSRATLLLDISFGLFVIAAATDMLDGYLARKYNLITIFGRIADPFVDKILVGGTFIFLIALTPEVVRPWMVVVMIGREFLISGLRGYAESQGYPFPADRWGKIKTVLQCVTIGVILFFLAHLRDAKWAYPVATGLMWATLGMTVFSGYWYLNKSKALWQKGM